MLFESDLQKIILNTVEISNFIRFEIVGWLLFDHFRSSLSIKETATVMNAFNIIRAKQIFFFLDFQ